MRRRVRRVQLSEKLVAGVSAHSVLGGMIGIAGLVWILAELDYARLSTILAEANIAYLLLVPLAIAAD